MSFLAQPVQTPLHFVPQLVAGIMPLLIAGAVFVLLVTFLKKRYLPKVKGVLGEWSVNRALRRKLNSEEYEVLQNLLLPDGQGGLTQIDHVVISAFGVFVIETKNWDCWIFGSEKGREWTLSYPGGAKVRAMNPLHQNAKHVRVICETLKVKPEHAHNLVFINPVSKMKTGPIPGVFPKGLLDYIRSFRVPVFPPEWPCQAVQLLRQTCQSHDKEAVKSHLEQVSSKQGRSQARMAA